MVKHALKYNTHKEAAAVVVVVRTLKKRNILKKSEEVVFFGIEITHDSYNQRLKSLKSKTKIPKI